MTAPDTTGAVAARLDAIATKKATVTFGGAW
jgi:hypothetical protein